MAGSRRGIRGSFTVLAETVRIRLTTPDNEFVKINGEVHYL